jgi:DNA polymerase
MGLNERSNNHGIELGRLANDIRSCRRCPGLNIPGETQAAPGYGDLSSRVAIVGQSLCGPCMATQIPFTGGSGRIIDDALRLAHLTKDQVFTTNVVHCHPPGNRASEPHEIENCSEYLRRELELVGPTLIVGLGRDAARWLDAWADGKCPVLHSFTSQTRITYKPTILLLPHPAYVLRQPEAVRQKYISELAQAIRNAATVNEQDWEKS